MAEHDSHRPGFRGEFLQIGLPLGILALGVSGFLILSRQAEPPKQERRQEQPPLVQTVAAEAHDRGLEIEVDGVVVPYREFELSAEVDGRVVYKADVCRAGQYVQRNTLLIEIDPQDYNLEKERLSQELRQAESSLEELEVEIKNTKALLALAERELALSQKELDRQKKLNQGYDNVTVVSESELDAAERNLIQAKNAKLTLDNRLQLLNTRRGGLEAAKKRAQALLDRAEEDLRRTKVLCPKDTDGVVVADLVEKDDYVRKGTPLVTIEDTSKVEVKCSLRLDELFWLWNQTGRGPGDTRDTPPQLDYQIPQAPVKVIYRLAGQDYEWDGVLTRYEGMGLDQATRTVPCRVVVGAPREVRVSGSHGRPVHYTGPPALVRGMFVTVKIHAEPRAELVRIPEAVVRPGNKVWVVRQTKTKAAMKRGATNERVGKLAVLDIRVAEVTDRAAIVLAGELKAGDRVVVTPLAGAKDGMIVREKAVR